MSEKTITIDGVVHELRVERDGARFAAGGGGLEVIEVRGHEATVRIGGRTLVIPFAMEGSKISFSYDGEIYAAEVADKGARSRSRHRDQSMSAPMPGLVLRVLVASGSVVEKGTPLVILEAMKMEHTIVAPRHGKVVAVKCKTGELVQAGVELIEFAAVVEA